MAEIEDEEDCSDKLTWVPEAEASQPDDDAYHTWSMVASPPFAADARLEKLAVPDEQQQGGLLKAKPRAGDTDVSDYDLQLHSLSRQAMPEGNAVCIADAPELATSYWP